MCQSVTQQFISYTLK